MQASWPTVKINPLQCIQKWQRCQRNREWRIVQGSWSHLLLWHCKLCLKYRFMKNISMEAYYHFQNSRRGVFCSTFQETQSQERKIKIKLISSPLAQKAIYFLGCPVSACTCLEWSTGLWTWDGTGCEVVVWRSCFAGYFIPLIDPCTLCFHTNTFLALWVSKQLPLCGLQLWSRTHLGFLGAVWNSSVCKGEVSMCLRQKRSQITFAYCL